MNRVAGGIRGLDLTTGRLDLTTAATPAAPIVVILTDPRASDDMRLEWHASEEAYFRHDWLAWVDGRSFCLVGAWRNLANGPEYDTLSGVVREVAVRVAQFYTAPPAEREDRRAEIFALATHDPGYVTGQLRALAGVGAPAVPRRGRRVTSLGPSALQPELWPEPPARDVLLDCRNRDCATFGWERTVRLQLIDTGVRAASSGYLCAYCGLALWTVNDEENPRP